MGCPDWPKCFGSWIPPTEVEQLPSDYKEIYANQRAEKNIRFTSYLDLLGLTNLADEIRNDKSILVEDDFNAAKTWTEYVNRLIGALIGLFIFATFVLSVSYIGYDIKVFSYAFMTLIVVGIQGWIGSIVVSTNLLQWMITLHMLLALVIVGLLTYLYLRVRKDKLNFSWASKSKSLQFILIILMILSIVQIVMGTQVRESVDMVAESLSYSQRDTWIDQLGVIFYIHRSFSIIILLAHIYLVYKVAHIYGNHGNLMLNSLVLLIVILAEIGSGAIMAWFSIPRFAQPIHLLLASIAFGFQFYLWLKVKLITNSSVPKLQHTKEVNQNVSYQVYS
jgi:cytochrome c oxidase assembly protein subunit 15